MTYKINPNCAFALIVAAVMIRTQGASFEVDATADNAFAEEFRAQNADKFSCSIFDDEFIREDPRRRGLLAGAAICGLHYDLADDMNVHMLHELFLGSMPHLDRLMAEGEVILKSIDGYAAAFLAQHLGERETPLLVGTNPAPNEEGLVEVPGVIQDEAPVKTTEELEADKAAIEHVNEIIQGIAGVVPHGGEEELGNPEPVTDEALAAQAAEEIIEEEPAQDPDLAEAPVKRAKKA